MTLNASFYLAGAERSKRARFSKPRLPTEIESIVLDTFRDLYKSEDLTWLLIEGRHISKHFRCEIERIFRTVLLSQTILRYNLSKLLR